MFMRTRYLFEDTSKISWTKSLTQVSELILLTAAVADVASGCRCRNVGRNKRGKAARPGIRAGVWWESLLLPLAECSLHQKHCIKAGLCGGRPCNSPS